MSAQTAHIHQVCAGRRRCPSGPRERPAKPYNRGFKSRPALSDPPPALHLECGPGGGSNLATERTTLDTMSDTSQGPGWWQASDGKWYAPELYPKDWPVPNKAADTAADTPAHAAPESSRAAGSVDVDTGEASQGSVFDTTPDSPPAADEPTLVSGIPAISTADLPPTTVHEAVPTERPDWSPPSAAPSSAPTWDAPGAAAEVGASAPTSPPPSSSPADLEPPPSMPSFEAPPAAWSVPSTWE